MNEPVDPIEDICACSLCGHGPSAHEDPDGRCLFSPSTTYRGPNDLMDWAFWKSLESTQDVGKQLDALDQLPLLGYPLPRTLPYAGHPVEVMHLIALGGGWQR